MTQHRTRFAIGALVALAITVPTGTTALASSQVSASHTMETAPAPSAQTWTVVPAGPEGPDGRASLEYIVEPGDTYTDAVAVRNLGEQPLTVSLYAQDAVQTSDNAFEVLTPEEGGASIAVWVQLAETDIVVPPRDKVIVPFTMTIPTAAEPGDHPGAIVAVNQPTGGDGATVQYRVGTRMQVRVAGAVNAAIDVDTINAGYETRWTPFASAPLDVSATLENPGNVRLLPAADVHAEGLFGWWSAQVPLEEISEILPDGAQSVAARVEDVPAIGPIWVTVDVTEVSSAGQDLTSITAVTSRTVVVWAVPWVLLAALLLLLIAAFVAVINVRRRRRAARAAEAAADEEAADASADRGSTQSGDADAGPVPTTPPQIPPW